MKDKILTYTEVIDDLLYQIMNKDKSVVCMGLGIKDPGAIFGTTKKIQKSSRLSSRVIEPPTSENCFTGVAVGMAISNMKLVLMHQRVDFSLYSMDQIINSAAKWRYMFDGKQNVSLVIRMIIGKGWGQGPTHSQSLHSLFSSIPGLKVVMPHGPINAKNLMLSAIYDKNPVIFLEHRWLHQTKEKNLKKKKIFKLGNSIKIKDGKDITIVTISYLVLEAKKIAIYLQKEFNISAEVIDLSTLSPNNYDLIIKSFKKTKKILFIDIGHNKCSIMKDVLHKVIISDSGIKNKNFDIITLPDIPIPTSHQLARYLYTDASIIIKKIFQLLKIKRKFSLNNSFLNRKNDTPGSWFKGPF